MLADQRPPLGAQRAGALQVGHPIQEILHVRRPQQGWGMPVVAALRVQAVGEFYDRVDAVLQVSGNPLPPVPGQLVCGPSFGGFPQPVLPDPFAAEQAVRVFDPLRKGAQSTTTGSVRALTGRDAHPFAAFARDHAGAFVGEEPVRVSA